MNVLKKKLIESCEKKLDYYDVVDEACEEIDYEGIIGFLLNELCMIVCHETWGD